MYERFSQWIAAKFKILGFISSQEEEEIFAFGAERIVSQMVSLLLLCLVGISLQGFFGCPLWGLLQSILFYICFYLSRKYAGGFHADSYVKCNTCYLLTFAVCIFGAKGLAVLPVLVPVFTGVSIFVMATVILLAPINNPNNPILPGKEREFFLKAIALEALFLGLGVILSILNKEAAVFVLCTLLASALYMHIEIIRRREWRMKIIKKTFGEKITKYVMNSAKHSTREVSMYGIYQAKRPAALDETVLNSKEKN